MHIFTRFIILTAILSGLMSLNNVMAYTLKAEKVIDNVYVFVGPLGQRSEANHGLNNNIGFIITEDGVILVDSGASRIGAQNIEKAIGEITDRPVKWVINTGSQDHRWLGNDYFASQGAELIAMQRTADMQEQHAEQHLQRMAGFLKKGFEGTRAKPAEKRLAGDSTRVTLGGQPLELRYTDAHYPGDTWLWLPDRSVLFTGDLVYVDRLVAVLPGSSVINAQKAFHALVELKPEYIVPGHGGVCNLQKARAESGDYYDFLVEKIGSAAQDMEPMQDILNQYEDLPRFRHLEHFQTLHRANMNRTYLEFEQL